MPVNVVRQKLRPSVYCLSHPSGKDDIPDLGLFEQAKIKKGEQPIWTEGVLPESGVVEVKGASHSIKALLASTQVTEEYLPAYGLLLATNLWQWRLVTGQGVVETLSSKSATVAPARQAQVAVTEKKRSFWRRLFWPW
jgi:hypothetical protein